MVEFQQTNGGLIVKITTARKKRDYPLPKNELFGRIIATTRKDNIGSERIQQKTSLNTIYPLLLPRKSLNLETR
jgi:hypothetical protein